MVAGFKSLLGRDSPGASLAWIPMPAPPGVTLGWGAGRVGSGGVGSHPYVSNTAVTLMSPRLFLPEAKAWLSEQNALVVAGVRRDCRGLCNPTLQVARPFLQQLFWKDPCCISSVRDLPCLKRKRFGLKARETHNYTSLGSHLPTPSFALSVRLSFPLSF